MSQRSALEALSRGLAPRPLVLVSTLAPDGTPNLAPFSMATPLSAEPPLVGVAILPRSAGGQKRTLSNLEATGEFVLNLVTPALLDAALSQSGRAALPLLPSERVAPPRVAGSPAQLECRLAEILRPARSACAFVVGEVVCFHLAPDLDPVGHLGLTPHEHLFATVGVVLRKPV